jgi:hypothetical protein
MKAGFMILSRTSFIISATAVLALRNKCPMKSPNCRRTSRPSFKLIGAFGEGFAVLAAAGGPDVHPHAVSSPDERARWDKDMLNFNEDLKKVETFFHKHIGKSPN